MDPPYWETEGYGVTFGWEQYEQLASMLRKLKAMVTLNDHPAIRSLFAGFHIESTDITYTVGGGGGAPRRELIIFSWDVRADPAGLV